jgi:hypothetical protein
MGMHFHCPEMNEKARGDSQIYASLGMYGEHYYLSTPLVLKGRGIVHIRTLKADELTPAAKHKAGWHEYRATVKATEKLAERYVVAGELLL